VIGSPRRRRRETTFKKEPTAVPRRNRGIRMSIVGSTREYYLMKNVKSKINPKFEYRNPKQYLNYKSECSKRFEFV